MKFIADVIKKEYEKWGIDGDGKRETIVYITAPTGTGKTTFILETLYKYAADKGQTILYLVNRKILKQQIENELIDIQNRSYNNIKAYIEVITYQELETLLLKPDINRDKLNWYRNFNYLVADEFHYFYNDSSFNTKTDLSYNFILYNNNILCKIFMSATMDKIKDYTNYIIEEWKKNNAPYSNMTFPFIKNYECQIKPYSNFNYIDDDEEIIELVKESKTKKWVIFIDNKEKGIKLNKLLEDEEITSVFVDAEYKSELAEKEIEKIIKNKKASCRVLIATSVLDSGVSLVDKNLENMIIYADVKETFMQMLGRKRRENENDTFNLYVKRRTKQHFLQRKHFVSERIKIYNGMDWNKEGSCDFILEKVFKSRMAYETLRNLCYVCQEQVFLNQLSIQYFRNVDVYYSDIIKRFERDGYNAFLYEQAEWLGIEIDDIKEQIKKRDNERYKMYHKKIKNFIEEYFKNEKNKKDENGNILMNDEERKAFRECIRKDIKKILPLKVDINDEEWEQIMNELIKSKRAFAADKFGMIMEALELDYCMEKPKRNAKDKRYILKRKENDEN